MGNSDVSKNIFKNLHLQFTIAIYMRVLHTFGKSLRLRPTQVLLIKNNNISIFQFNNLVER